MPQRRIFVALLVSCAFSLMATLFFAPEAAKALSSQGKAPKQAPQLLAGEQCYVDKNDLVHCGNTPFTSDASLLIPAVTSGLGVICLVAGTISILRRKNN